MNDLLGKTVKANLWGYVPSIDGEDVDKDIDGEILGVVKSATEYNPQILRIKVEKYKPNILNAEFTEDLSEIGQHFIGGARNYKDGYLEEWYYNLQVME